MQSPQDMVDQGHGQRAPPTDSSRPSTWRPPPSWLSLPPTDNTASLPTDTRPEVLPIAELSWENFERLCLRLLELEAEPIHTAIITADTTTMPVAGLYGERGQAQSGIDVYARDPLPLGGTAPQRCYTTLQARRVERPTAGDMRNSIRDFLEGRWSSVSRRFIYATSASTNSTDLVHEKEAIAGQLRQQEIEFVMWDQREISRRMKEQPRVVDDFFSRPWVERFCGEPAAQSLGSRLDGQQVNDLRRELARIYSATFGVADSGLIPFQLGNSQPVALVDRFVTPDLVSTTFQEGMLSDDEHELGERAADRRERDLLLWHAEATNAFASDQERRLRDNPTERHRGVYGQQVLDRRSADQWLGTERLQVIVGDPGTGKSTLLRYLVLDLLSKEPKWTSVADRWGQRLPIWLPFHFFTQRVADQTGSEASVRMAIRAWLEQFDADQAWQLVDEALNDERLLLIVDGLDEWVSDEAGRYAVRALETFATFRSTPMVISTRPYGLSRLTLGPDWKCTRIASLTTEQQRRLVSHYFRAALDDQDRAISREVVERSVNDFLSNVQEVPDLRFIIGTPLFLVLLVGLRLSNMTSLPAGRFDAYSHAVQLLVSDHPAQRRTAADVTASRQRLSTRELRALLARIEFTCQVRGEFATIGEQTLRNDLQSALSDPASFDLELSEARDLANQIMDVAEGELGILVRKGLYEVGFLHRILQEQLAGEFISSQLDLGSARELFAKHCCDPRWHEVLLASMWRLERPSELGELIEIIRSYVDDTPAGLRARELLAEVTFGPYGLSATQVKRNAPDIIQAIESHAYDPHRVYLLESLVSGLAQATTSRLVKECLRRWTLLTKEPYPALLREVGRVHSTEGASDEIRHILLRALRHPYVEVAFGSVAAIAERYASVQSGREQERALLRTELLEMLGSSSTGLATAATLSALALGWRDDSVVDEVIGEARDHSDASTRLVALGDALGVLKPTLAGTMECEDTSADNLNDEESQWLAGLLVHSPKSELHDGLLVASISRAAKCRETIREDLVSSVTSAGGPYSRSHLLWSVALHAISTDQRVVDIVCHQLRTEKHPDILLGLQFEDLRMLGTAYPVGSLHNEQVAAAIEARLSTFRGSVRERELYEFSAVDRGPVMKKALIEELDSSTWPHWAAEALAEFFSDDADARIALGRALMGDAPMASRVANVASRVLPRDQVIPRLLAVLNALDDSADQKPRRYDLVADAIARACQNQAIVAGPELDSIAETALSLMPTTFDSLYGDPRYELAASLWPSHASEAMLDQLSDVESCPLIPYLRVSGSDPDRLRWILAEVGKTVYALPAFLRKVLCQALADRTLDPELVQSLTRLWAEEVSPSNKSVASLAYYRSLVRARRDDRLSDEQWNLEKSHLAKQASCYGPDYKSRRRGAWVGMCVLRDWSMVTARTEMIGPATDISVELFDPIHGPDQTLLQELAARWEDLRSVFGEDLLVRLSGRSQREESSVWDALALVATHSRSIDQQLENAVANDPSLLNGDGVLAWFATRGGSQSDLIVNSLISRLQRVSDNLESTVSSLVSDPERIGISRQELVERLASTPIHLWSTWGDACLESLALLDPNHSQVRNAWDQLCALAMDGQSDVGAYVHPRTCFAVTYAAANSSEILGHLAWHLDWLDDLDAWFFDRAFCRHVCHRLRRDSMAVAAVRDGAINLGTPKSRSTQLIALIAEAVGLDEELGGRVEESIRELHALKIAPMTRDLMVSDSRSLRSVLIRAADVSWGAPAR